jgi:hypothetical protein
MIMVAKTKHISHGKVFFNPDLSSPTCMLIFSKTMDACVSVNVEQTNKKTKHVC